MASKKSSRKKKPQLNHEQRVFFIGGRLLDTLANGPKVRADETVKAVGWFLVCLGESYEKDSLQKARALKASQGRNNDAVSSLGVGLCWVGDQIMDWSTGLFHQEKATREAKKSKAPKPISGR